LSISLCNQEDLLPGFSADDRVPWASFGGYPEDALFTGDLDVENRGRVHICSDREHQKCLPSLPNPALLDLEE